MKALVAIGALCPLMVACASWDPETRALEAAYQTVSAIDTAQSVELSKHLERYSEVGWPTRYAIGNKPSPAASAAWGVGRGMAHAYVTDVLERGGSPLWLKRGWQCVSIGVEAGAVGHNYSIGLRVGL